MTQDIKKNIYYELENSNFPDLEFLYSHEALKLALIILEELLTKERNEFYSKLKTPDDEICFETFDDVSILEYYFGILDHYQGVHGDDDIRKIIEAFEPKYIDFGNEVAYSARYYEMLELCYSRQSLNTEQRKIISDSIERFKVRGINMQEQKQERLKIINKKLSEIAQKFSNNVVDSKKEFEYHVDDKTCIDEMPEDDKLLAKLRAEKMGKKGYLFDASQGSYMSIMKYCSDSSIRKDFYQARQMTASGGKYNNKPLILEMLSLRQEKAEILGFENYAQLSLVFKMADSPEQIIELFSDISRKAKPKAQSEIDEICEYFKLEDIQNWDIGYYANKLKQEKYSFDSKELKKYFVFENVLEGMFETIFRLYNLEFKEIQVNTYNKDVTVYKVFKDGRFLSYFFTDFFYNELKRPGAWANILRETSPKGKKIVLNVCNFQKGADGLTLLTLGDVETMFHEFGHATHEILSRSEYSQLSGFHVEHDFIELPSQLLENWCRDAQGMKLFAKHYKTGEMVPDDMLSKLKILDTFGNGQFIIGQNIYAMMDMMLHSSKVPSSEQELDEKVNQSYDTHSLLPRGEVYSPHASFTHIFDGGYAAGYYSYMWAEIIEKEVWKAFKDSGNIFSPEIAQKFHDTILGAGSIKKASQLFRDFFGRDVDINAFLEEKGLL